MYKMLERYFELHPVLDADDVGIMELMPSRRQVNSLKVLLGKLVDFQSATMKLQDDGMTLLAVQDIFDAFIEKHPVVGTYLSADAAIIKDPDFESACVLALSGRIEGFTGDQQLMLHPFETTPQAVIPDSTAGHPQSFADKVLAARKKQRTAKKMFDGVLFISPMSNSVERLFSVVKHTLSHHRQRMLPIHLETVLFLKMNRRFWDANSVERVVNAK
ncbi:hypothetical protein JG687_00008468 [Phytophthora cactorum]|nr:hypothetical protein PC119_g25837 [Phytophthora cactorum]KAG6959981.1 hypothetical protein JG687_00008468 [Phytophthora cactorum]